MKKIFLKEFIRVMNEEFERKLQALSENVAPMLHKDIDGDNDQETLVSFGLKLKHKKSGIRYTVDSVGPDDVILKTPEGNNFIIDKEQLEDEYELA